MNQQEYVLPLSSCLLASPLAFTPNETSLPLAKDRCGLLNESQGQCQQTVGRGLGLEMRDGSLVSSTNTAGRPCSHSFCFDLL